MALIDIIFPKKCLGCSTTGSYLCNICMEKISPKADVCPYCEKPSIDGFTHFGCKRKFGLDGLISLWGYEGIIKKAILALKFKYATEVAADLLNYVVTELGKKPVINNCFLVPIPIFWYRENVRGFNQSELIGKIVADKMSWKFIPDLLTKTKPTRPQVELKVKERKENLQGVFSLNSNYLVPSKYSLVLFDDVFTTGSTLKEACRILKMAGIQKVWGMTIAR